MAWQRLRFSLLPFAASLLVALAASGCGSDDSSAGSGGEECAVGEEFNPLSGQCQPRAGDGFLDANEDAGDSTKADAGGHNDADDPLDSGGDITDEGDASSEDGGEDAGRDVADPPQCPDRDGDGAADQACGGTDCDDSNPSIAPGMPEVCDEHDNDCDGQLNQGAQCAFYAHSPSTLYLVDPFAKTATEVTAVPTNLFDLDTHPDGTLYGITSSTLYKFNQGTNSWTSVGPLGMSGTPNGLAIDNLGTAYVTASNTVYTVDLVSGTATSVGAMGGSYSSSGDCVVNKDNSLYMSSSPTGFSTSDTLVLIDGNTAQAQTVGSIGIADVYGLTAAWGRMFGLTGNGRLIEINTGTGAGTVVHTFSNVVWNGAASTPQR